jgi:hypothetical protein
MAEYSLERRLEGFEGSCHRFEALASKLGEPASEQLEHAELEELVGTEGRELLRSLLQDHLNLRAARERHCAGVVNAQAVECRHVRRRVRRLMTLFGPVQVSRLGYCARGVESVFPADKVLNLPPELYSHGLRRRVADEASKVSFDEVVRGVEGGGGHVPKRQAEQLAARAARDFDAFYERAEAAEKEATQDPLILTLDGKGIVVRPQDLRDKTRKRAATERHKLAYRLSGGEKRNRKRMATVAAVYTIARHVRTPEQIMNKPLVSIAGTPPRARNKRVWASLQSSAHEVTHEAFAEAARRDPRQQRHWAVLVDGDEAQLRRVRAMVARCRKPVTLVLDFVHVLERLWEAAWAFFGKGDPKVEDWVRVRALAVLSGKSSGVAAGIRRSATKRGLSGPLRAAVDETAGYLLTYKNLLHYDRYLAAGLPIATGVIEGACRHLIKDRMDLTGARWSLLGAEAVLRLRSLRASNDFDTYWSFHLRRERERNHPSENKRAA